MSKSWFDDKLEEFQAASSEDAVPKFPFDPDGQTRASQQRRWEHRVVGILLKHYGLVGQAAAMVKQAKERDGLRHLTLEVFHHWHPTFPLWLSARKVPYVHETSMSDFARRFSSTKLYKEFSEAEADVPDAIADGPSGLVFEWLHVWPTAIIHNHYHATQRQELVIFYRFQRADQLMAIQSLGSFLESLPWVPDQASR